MDTQLSLPSNFEAEAALLGSLMVDGMAFEIVSQYLTAKDFYITRHAWIYQAMSDLSVKGLSFDVVTLGDLLQKRGLLVELGGAAYLTQLAIAMPTAMHVEDYARIIKGAALKRQVIQASQQIARMAFEGEQGGIDTINQAQQIIFSLDQGQTSTFRHVSEAINDYLDRYEYYQANPDALKGLNLGIDEIDQLLKGLHGGDSVILGGRPGAGKTAMATDIALRVAKRGEAVGFISLEMTEDGLIQRLIGNEAEIDTTALRYYKQLTKEEFRRFTQSHKLVTNLPLIIDDTSSQTLTQIAMKARRMVREHGLKLLIIDYLQLIEADNPKAARHEQIAQISRGLKIMARELNISILTLSQISRAVDSRMSKEPQLGDLSEGSGIEKDADVVIFLWLADEESAPNVATMKVAKNRSGATGKRELFFQKEYMRFRSVGNALEY